ncbi:hypothetical protein [Sphingomonas solaris]|uniref:Preprotein translocase subunit YajC n=1 Tax=Alterirhizorhabdus solaris TaxID=2529389 RepID=A0A558R9U4_9SPHN|nr:hypothetical protein [Sphingomonas solaris]TVV76128.1 hypothetical protein FOY91_05150 [Sphingomonas solaris]
MVNTAFTAIVLAMPASPAAAQAVPVSSGSSTSSDTARSDSTAADDRPAKSGTTRPRRSITPYLEVQQVIDFDLAGNDPRGTNTYTAVAAGVQASVDTRNLSGTIDYRYEHRFGWGDGLADQDIHTGLARGRVGLVPDLVSLEGGLLATRARTDIRGDAPTLLIGDQSNLSQVYGLYAGPALATRVGDLDVAASYRFGYVKVKTSTDFALAAGQPRLDGYDSSTNHAAAASVGMRPGVLGVGWKLSAGYEREDTAQLDQRYDGKFVRAEVTVPVSRTLALVGSVGYEKIEASQRAPLIDAAGQPVVNSNGRYVTDPASPRLLAYDTDGLIYDGGVIWRPNRRTTLEARLGHRYGGTIFNGSFDWQIDSRSGLRIGVYDQIDSFGRGLTRGISSLPTQFTLARNPFGNAFTGCVFGATPGTGGCLNNVFQSISTANFRSRGVYALYSGRNGRWTYGLGGGYSQRRFLAPEIPGLFTLNGVEDESWSVQGNLGRRITTDSGVDFAVYGDLYRSGIAGAGDVKSGAATANYYRTLGDHLTANAAVGLFAFDTEGFETDVSGTLLLGMRYAF